MRRKYLALMMGLVIAVSPVSAFAEESSTEAVAQDLAEAGTEADTETIQGEVTEVGTDSITIV